MGELFDKLANYGNSGIYPFHMPGHKRQKTVDFNPYKIDITEIEGFDNLHHAEGVLLEAQKKAEKLYGSEESHFLINGSTAGILSAVSACAKKTVLIARNCHKAVYHAALIRNLDVYYVYPEIQEEFMLNGGINPADVERSLEEHPEIEAVVITSPTYDGIVSDVKRIAEIAHAYGKPLIVDEAHGAHFGFSKYFPENSVHLGAERSFFRFYAAFSVLFSDSPSLCRSDVQGIRLTADIPHTSVPRLAHIQSPQVPSVPG